jgi:FkbM family methyltransferase
MELDLRDNVQRALYQHGSYEPKVRNRISRGLRRGDIYVDIGAHVGIHALIAARRLQELGGGHVYAFEPATDSGDRLAMAAKRNGLENLTLVRAAVGESTGRLQLRSDPAFGDDDPAVRSAFGPGPVVGDFPVVGFDEWASDQGLSRLSVVKVDIEGGELAALKGMRASLVRLRPRLLIVEVSPELLRRGGQSKEQLYAELARSGYRPEKRLGRNVVFARREP